MNKCSPKDCQGECQQESYRQGCIELAKHIGVLSVGLSFILYNIVKENQLNSLVNIFAYASIVAILFSFCASVIIIYLQLPSYLSRESDIKDLRSGIRCTIGVFIVGTISCFISLIIILWQVPSFETLIDSILLVFHIIMFHWDC